MNEEMNATDTSWPIAEVKAIGNNELVQVSGVY